jgi:signal transduction histidine kinase/DNA-binding response OmpR family regulator
VEEKTLLTDEEYQTRISELEKTVRKKDREISRLQTGIEQEKIFANVKANMIAAKTIVQRIRDRYLQLLLDNSSDIIICLNNIKRIVFCSNVLIKLAGAQAGSESGRQIDEFLKGVCDDRCIETLTANVSAVLAGNETRSVPLEICFSSSTELRKCVIDFIPMSSSETGNEGAMVIFNDVTDIERAREDAELASAAKSEFLLDMSHEIRTPLNAVMGMTAIARKSDSIERKEYCLKKIEDASTHLLDVINDIVDISKIETNRLELSLESFVFEKMVQKAVNSINFQVEEKRQYFSVNLDDNIPHTLTGDSKRLIQIITNLLTNAVKFTPEGGNVRLDARLETAESGVHMARIEVADSGIGISAENQARLFHSFHRNASNASGKFGKSGIGLAISRHLVELMGGRIWVDSELGMGATFGFTFPARRGDESENKLLSNNSYWANKRALVVDDAPNTLVYFRNEAPRLSISCDVVLSGEAALEQIGKNDPYDICFIDWKMPGMNGIETAARIRELGAGKPSIVLMISAAEWKLAEEDAKKAGVERYIQKPLFRSDIIDCLIGCFGPKPAEGARAHVKKDDFSGFRVLLVEDMEINREIVLAFLEPTGLEIECAQNGKTAVKMVMGAEKPYDLIFMDLQMPEMNGFEATFRIRQFEEGRYGRSAGTAKQTPIIAMTASVFHDDIEKCLEKGMNDHLGLPMDVEEVLKKLRFYLKPGGA